MRRNVYRNELNPVQDLSQSCTGLWSILYTFFAFAKLLIIRQLAGAENDAEELTSRFLAPTHFLAEEKMSKFFTTFSLLAGSFCNTDVRVKRVLPLAKLFSRGHARNWPSSLRMGISRSRRPASLPATSADASLDGRLRLVGGEGFSFGCGDPLRCLQHRLRLVGVFYGCDGNYIGLCPIFISYAAGEIGRSPMYCNIA